MAKMTQSLGKTCEIQVISVNAILLTTILHCISTIFLVNSKRVPRKKIIQLNTDFHEWTIGSATLDSTFSKVKTCVRAPYGEFALLPAVVAKKSHA